MRRLSLSLILLAVATLHAQGQSGQKWLEVQTPHFTVLTNSGEHDGRKIAVQFERMRAVFHTLMPNASDDPASPIIVLALKDAKSFRTLEPEAYLAKDKLQLAGYFLRAQDRNYVLVRMDQEGPHPFSTVYHEYTHYMMRKGDGYIPLWLNEGLAEFYQNATILDKDVRIGQPSSDDILYLRQNKLLPLSTLLAVDHDSPYYHDEQKGSVFYAQSWALTHYLEMWDFEHKAHRMQDYVADVRKGESPVTAAQHAFGDLAQLQKALDSYVSGMDFKELKLLAPVDFTEASFAVRPLSAAEADAVRGDVLVGVGRTKDAETLLEAVVAEDPKLASAREAMGGLKFREGDTAAAKKWYGEAVELDSKSYLANYYFAVMSLQSGDQGHDEAIEKSLRMAIQSNPRFAGAYDALAHLYSMQHEKLDDAVGLSQKAVELEPESVPYRVNQAHVLMQDRKPDEALHALRAARAVAKTANEKAVVVSQISQMEQYTNAKAESEKRQAESEKRNAESQQVIAEAAKGLHDPGPGEMHRYNPPDPPSDEPAFPSDTSGKKHTATGVLGAVKCHYPAVMTLSITLSKPPATVALYANNYYKVPYATQGFQLAGDMKPCSMLEGAKARVEYSEVTDSRVEGQIVSVTLIK